MIISSGYVISEGVGFTQGETGIMPSHFLQWLIKSSLLDSQHTEVMNYHLPQVPLLVDLFHLVWQSSQFLFKKPEWVASVQHTKQEPWVNFQKW